MSLIRSTRCLLLVIALCSFESTLWGQSTELGNSKPTAKPPVDKSAKRDGADHTNRVSQSDAFSKFMVDIQGFGETKGGLAAANMAYNTAVLLFGEQSSQAALAMTGLGFSNAVQGDYVAAESFLKKALSINRKLYPTDRRRPGQQQLAVNLEVLGLVYKQEGDFVRAEALLREALEIRTRLLGNDSIDTASSLDNIADLYFQMGDYWRAQSNCRRALEIVKARLGTEHWAYANSLRILGFLYEYTGDHAKAEPLLRQAREIFKKLLGPEHQRYAVILFDLASMYLHKRDFDRAEPLFQQALDIEKKLKGNEHADYASGLSWLGLLYADKGDYPKAERDLQQALKIDEKALGAAHPACARLLNNLAYLHQLMGDDVGAERFAREALHVIENHVVRATSILSERQQMLLRTSNRHLLDRYLSLADAGRVNPSDLYEHCLRWKGAAFTASSEVRALRQNPELEPLFHELEYVSTQLSTLSFKTPGPKQRDAWSRQLSRLTDRKEEIERDLSGKNADFRRQKELQHLTPTELRKSLPKDSALVDFLEYLHLSRSPDHRGQLRSVRHLAAFVFGSERDVAYVDLGPVDPIRSKINTWRSTFGESDSALDSAKALKKAVWDPLASHLSGVKTVLISPDGDLGRLAFAALPGSAEGTYLIEDFNLVVVPVPRLLAAKGRSPDSEAAHQTAVLIGDINFDGDPSNTILSNHDQALFAQAVHRSALRTTEIYFPALPGTAPEIDEIAAMHAQEFGPARHKTIRGLRATEEAVRSEAPHCAYLHLATHGFFQPVDERRNQLQEDRTAGSFDNQEQVAGFHPGLQSGLALAGVNRKKTSERPEEALNDDGILTALEVASLDLRGVQLVTLSACETGLGKATSGEGVLGLQRAFQIAGARNVVASLWKVDDQATATLMRLFYHKLWVEKKKPATALREAQLEILRHPERSDLLATTRAPRFEKAVKLIDRRQDSNARTTASPRLWAAFVLSGDG
jgi:CHAT domain-containing protein/tetratricopeptide (TPR) repeat protein